jgi:hypothetical protein
MNRLTSLAYLSAVTLLANGCVETTSAFADDEDENLVPSTQAEYFLENVPSRDVLLRAWQLPPTSAWSPYQKLTLPSVLGGAPEQMSLPRLDDMDQVRYAAFAGAQVAREGIPPDAMWIVDLPGAASVAFGTALSRQAQEPVAIVPTFNNWPSKDQLVPADETLAAMIHMTPNLEGAASPVARPVFLLDSWRLAFKDETIDDEVVDNRYMLGQADFPSAYELLSHGITHIVYVVSDLSEADYEEDDLNAVFLAYQEAGIEVHMVDVGQLAGVVVEQQPTTHWYIAVGNRFYVRPRRVCVHDEWFYRRAHGGFGGVHGAPIAVGHVFVFGGHGGG